MNSKWFKSCKTQEEKDKRKAEILSYRNGFEELTTLLSELYEEKAPDYDNPSWSHKQADVNGANRMLRKIIELINIKE